MKLATLRLGSSTTAAVLDNDVLRPLDAPDVGAVLGTDPVVRARPDAAPIPVEVADFAPPVLAPSAIVCVGLNYLAHISEGNREVPEYPTLFAKFTDALIGARDDVVLPAVSAAPDWEVELAVVVGTAIRRAGVDEARAAIGGFAVLNDISLRDWQRRTSQWLQGKAFERLTPFGPYVVTPDEVDGAEDLEITCEVDDVVVQQSRTSDLLFGPAALVSYVSQIRTLRPGDVIASGTPSGVGAARQPPVYLRPGSVLRSRIEGLGQCVNRCVAEST
ncbi:MAG: fumarylacetoacetate hydrolase family protein [Actinomycetota bacterium]|nr:fumarylacetoacetate hydrolase family protein [Actinomycetota bacterium]